MFGWLKRQAAPAAPAATPPEGAVLIDVRTRGEFAGGHIAGSLNLPLDELPARIASVAPDKDAPLLLFCASGARSGRAAAFLAGQGYTQVHNGGGVGTVAVQLGLTIQRG